jgi:hypothetical protein
MAEASEAAFPQNDEIKSFLRETFDPPHPYLRR